MLRFVVQHNLVDCIVTSAGGVEEDLIKCLLPSYLGDFRMDGKQLRLVLDKSRIVLFLEATVKQQSVPKCNWFLDVITLILVLVG